jgi:hypothetical protein
MKTRMFAVTLVACLASNGCAPRYSLTVPGPTGVSAEAESAVQEVVVRNVLDRESMHDLVFLAFGESRLDCDDPPDVFLDGLAGVGSSLEPVSHLDALSNPTAPLLLIGPIRWASETKASLPVTWVRRGVGASDGFTVWMEWGGGEWRIAKTSRHWST